MHKILITGATGFIGSHLAEAAAASNMKVYAGIRRTSDTTYLKGIRCRLFEMDLTNPEALEQAFSKQLQEEGGFDFVFHNAGLTQNKRQKNFTAINYRLTQNLVHALVQSGNRPSKLVYTSSISASGPASLQKSGILNEDCIDRPVTPYGESKKQAEAFLLESAIPAVILRVPPVYGPREANMLPVFRMLNKGLLPLLGCKDQHLSMIYVKDLAGFFLKALQSPAANTIFFVSDGENYTQKRMLTAIARVMNRKTVTVRLPLFFVRMVVGLNMFQAEITGRGTILNKQKYREIASRNWTIDASRAIKSLEYTPHYSVEKGMAETLQWYQQNGWL